MTSAAILPYKNFSSNQIHNTEVEEQQQTDTDTPSSLLP